MTQNKSKTNKTLAIFASPIPYYPQIRSMTGGVLSAILMQQLEYWFAMPKYSKGFYKFLAPCQNKLCKKGDSWEESLGFSSREFKTAFKAIGIAYKSKNQFRNANNAGDVFEGKFYCSYHDRLTGLTWYFRNDNLVDRAIDDLVNSVNDDQDFLVNDDRAVTRNDEPLVPYYTETTNRDYPTEITDPEHNADREKPEQTYYYVDTMCGGDENFSVVGNHQQNEDHTSPTYSQTLAIAPNNFSLVTNPTSKDKVSRGFSLSREKSSPTPLDELLNQEYYLGYNNIPCDGPYRLIGPLTAQRMQWVIFHRSDAFKLLRGHDGELYVRSAFDGVLHGPEAIAKHKLKKLFQLADDSNPLHEEMGLDHHWYNEEMRTAFMFFREYVKTHNITSNFSVGQLLLEMGEIKAESMTEEDYEEFMVF